MILIYDKYDEIQGIKEAKEKKNWSKKKTCKNEEEKYNLNILYSFIVFDLTRDGKMKLKLGAFLVKLK